MEILRICGLSLTAFTALLLLRQWKSEIVAPLRIGALVLIMIFLVGRITPLLQFLKELTHATGIQGYATILFEALGVAFLSYCCAAACREGGETGLASILELAGRIEILLLSLPLIQEILTTARTLLSVGG